MPERSMRATLVEQLSPVALILDRLVDTAYAATGVQTVAAGLPAVRRAAHLKRISGSARWAVIADGLVDSHAAGEFPEGFGVRSTDADHNSGRYVFSFPGGIFTLRREPHDESRDEGRSFQQHFTEVIAMVDAQVAPSSDPVKVYVRVAPDGMTKLTACDRHGHEHVVSLTELLEHGMEAAVQSIGAADRSSTGVRSTRPKIEQE